MSIVNKRLSTSPAIDCRLVMGFEAVRRKLLECDLRSDGEKPLGYWALPDDRCLPLALMNRTLRDVIEMDFDILYSTPGVGPKKIGALIALLHRAALPAPNAEPEPAVADTVNGHNGISEARWEKWCASVVAQGLEGETFGRFAAALDRLPRGLWRVTLGTYARRSLAEIRQLKAHGDKRVTAIADVFKQIHSIVSQLEARPHLTVRIRPRFAARIESWVEARLGNSAPLRCDEIQAEVLVPLIDQVATDLGEAAARLARHRLPPQSCNVQQMARRLGLTRGRVYELLVDITTVIDVRWPEGRVVARRLLEQTCDGLSPSDPYQLVLAATQIFFAPQTTAAPLLPQPCLEDAFLAVH